MNRRKEKRSLLCYLRFLQYSVLQETVKPDPMILQLLQFPLQERLLFVPEHLLLDLKAWCKYDREPLAQIAERRGLSHQKEMRMFEIWGLHRVRLKRI